MQCIMDRPTVNFEKAKKEERTRAAQLEMLSDSECFDCLPSLQRGETRPNVFPKTDKWVPI